MRIPTTAPTNPRRRPACSAACFAIAVARVEPKQMTAPAGATIPADGRIDDFEGSATATGGTTPAKFGAGWTATTDQMAGGVSPGGRGPGARPIGTRCQ